MDDSKQVQFFAFTGVVVASGNDPEFFGQAPTFRQNSSRFGVVYTELFGFEIEQIQTLVRRVSNDGLVFPRVGNF